MDVTHDPRLQPPDWDGLFQCIPRYSVASCGTVSSCGGASAMDDMNLVRRTKGRFIGQCVDAVECHRAEKIETGH